MNVRYMISELKKAIDYRGFVYAAIHYRSYQSKYTM